MNQAALNILKIFAEMERQQLDLHVLFEAAGNKPANRERVFDAIEDLQRDGLVESIGGDFYSLTEKGKLAVNTQAKNAPE